MKAELKTYHQELHAMVKALWKQFPCSLDLQPSSVTYPFVLNFQNLKGSMEIPELTGSAKTTILNLQGRQPFSQAIYRASDLATLLPAVGQLKELLKASQALPMPENFNTQSNFGLELANYHTKIYLSADYTEPKWIVRREAEGHQVRSKSFINLSDPARFKDQAVDMISATADFAGVRLQTKFFDPFDL
jgi:hypothetical protein